MAPTGTRIDAQATIVFDTNPPIDTPLIFNTVNVGPPTSTVNPLPPVTSSASFNVSWSGRDDADGKPGSGIASFDVYVSDNGAPFVLWLQNTTDNSATFNGQAQHTYGFYAVATDQLGHVQAAPTTADTVTRLKVNTRPGDFNLDGTVNVQDVDELFAAIRAGGTDVRFDLDGNARVDEADVTALVEDILGTRRGDTNLDRAVDFGDFITFSSHFGSSVNSWGQGDFNGDGLDDFSDFIQLASVFGFSASGADFNGDKIVDATDIDLLFRAIRSGQPAIRFDLNGDAVVNQADATYMIEQLIGTRRGDANLDGNVDFADFIRLSDDFGRAGTWRDGDFDGNEFVDFGDFLILSSWTAPLSISRNALASGFFGANREQPGASARRLMTLRNATFSSKVALSN